MAADSAEKMEKPRTPDAREAREAMPEGAAETAENVAGDAETFDRSASEETAALVSRGETELDRVKGQGDIPREEIDADPEAQAAQGKLGDVGNRLRDLYSGVRDKIGAVMKDLRTPPPAAADSPAMTRREFLRDMAVGAAGLTVAGAMEARPAEASKGVEQKEGEKTGWEKVLADAERAMNADETLKDQIGAEGREGFIEGLRSWNPEQVRADAAELAGIPLDQVSKDNYKKIEVWSEKTFGVRASAEKLSQTMDSQAENDEIRIRADKFRKNADGQPFQLDANKLHKGMTHELIHVKTTADVPGGEVREERLWDGEGVPHDLNEGVTELLSLRVAEKQGKKTEHQAYAGGNLVAARLLEGLIGREPLFGDLLKGTTNDIKKAVAEKLGPGAYDAIMKKRVGPGDDREGKSIAFEIVMAGQKAGIDMAKEWQKAKAEGFKDDLRVSPDGKSVTISRDIDGKFVLANTVHDNGEPLSPHSEPLRILALSHDAGDPLTSARVGEVAAGINQAVNISEKLLPVAESSFATQQEIEAEKGNPPLDREEFVQTTHAGMVAEAKMFSMERGEPVPGTTIVFNTREALAPLQAEFAKASTPAEKAAIKARIEEKSEHLAANAAKAIRDAVSGARKGGVK